MAQLSKIFYITHYYEHGSYFASNPTEVEVEEFSIDVTEGIAKIVQVEYLYQSAMFENENPRNLSLLLVGLELHVGLGQLYDHDYGVHTSEWSCGNSSTVMHVDSQDFAEIMFYRARISEDSQTVRHKEFLSFSWSLGSGGNIHGTWGYLFIVISMALYYTFQL